MPAISPISEDAVIFFSVKLSLISFLKQSAMHRKKPDVDVINDVLLMAIEAYPGNEFLKGLHSQYHDRGGLSRKQLQGLHLKAVKAGTIPAGKLATIEAEILKKPVRFKSERPAAKPLYTKDLHHDRLIREILEKYPEHKKVLFLQTKFENNQPLTPWEVTELERFHKILLKPT